MRLVGVDLASQPKRTSLAVIEAGRVVMLISEATDDTIIEHATGAHGVGIDAPLGWPDAFVETITAHHGHESIPAHDPRNLRLRRTDVITHERSGKQPLSVSTDLIGVVALRAIRLLERLSGVGAARDGSAGVYETYPGSAVAIWDLVTSSYKPKTATDQRAAIVGALSTHLDLGGFDDQMIANDDDLDAVLCAAVAGLAASGATFVPDSDDVSLAQREGWIHIPSEPITSLGQLRTAG